MQWKEIREHVTFTQQQRVWAHIGKGVYFKQAQLQSVTIQSSWFKVCGGARYRIDGRMDGWMSISYGPRTPRSSKIYQRVYEESQAWAAQFHSVIFLAFFSLLGCLMFSMWWTDELNLNLGHILFIFACLLIQACCFSSGSLLLANWHCSYPVYILCWFHTKILIEGVIVSQKVFV